MRRVFYFIKKALTGMKSAPFVNLVTIGTIALSLFIFSAFLLFYSNMSRLLRVWENRLGVTAYLMDGAGEEQIAQAADLIGAIEGVEAVNFVSSEMALSQFKRILGDEADLLEGLEENPLPRSFEISVAEKQRTPQRIAEIAAAVEKVDQVEEVHYGREWIFRFAEFMSIMKAVGLILGSLLLLGGILIISNTIKLTVFARKEEIEIMRLVGATNSFIKIPFLIEGLLQGLLGAGLAMLATWAIYRIFLAGVSVDMGIGRESAGLQFIETSIAAWLMAGGAAVGLVGSALALGRFLKV